MKKRTIFGILVLLMTATVSIADRPEPKVVATIGGDDVFEVLSVGEIPAIDEPEYLAGAAADEQMQPDEPVLGVVVEGQAMAYSLWQLDAHEIVNDRVGSTEFAATW